MLNDLMFNRNIKKSNASIEDAKEIFGQNRPYFKEARLGGDIFIFNDHFIRELRAALSDGCMAKMNYWEVLTFKGFINYQNARQHRDITLPDYDVYEALDEWVMREWQCQKQPKVNECFDSPKHEWACTI